MCLFYSPPRITKRIKEMKCKHLMAGLAFDPAEIHEDNGKPWDFSIKAKREKAWKKVIEPEPYMLIGSPACAPVSTWQRLNEARSSDAEAMRRANVDDVVHLDFVARLYTDQVEQGRYFLHERPLHATSCVVHCIGRVLRLPNVVVVHGDQCQFG